MNNEKLNAVSLFTSSGIGDIALHEAGIETIVANEIITDRTELFKFNFPDSMMIVGDIWDKQNEIIANTKRILENKELDVLFATPPCQGMSKNGRGKLLNSIRKGLKPKLDKRNQLIIPAMNIAVALNPRIIVMENVPEMEITIIEDENGNPINLLEYIKNRLSDSYTGSWEVVEFADYGVPQKRQRLISVFSRDDFVLKYFNHYSTFLPPKTHAKIGSNILKPWVTIRESIENLPKLDSSKKELATSDFHRLHRVPLLDSDKYFWVSNTPPEKKSFDNQCVNPDCMFDQNVTHGASKNKNGVNKANTETPIYCQKCGEVLPRPWVKTETGYRIMKGFTSAYKRMKWDEPSSTLTRNLSYACSDNKLHPEQNRVLSLYEASILHTLDSFPYEWKRFDNKKVSDKLIRDSIGESIPPKGLRTIFNHLAALLKKDEHSISKPINISKQLNFL